MRCAYEQVLKLIIRPPRARYELDKLGPNSFLFCGVFIERSEFSTYNARGLRVEYSWWRPRGSMMPGGAADKTAPPALLYMHGNASCRVEALQVMPLLISAHRQRHFLRGVFSLQ